MTANAAADFSESYIEADGFRIRLMQAGEGMPLVHLHGAGGTRWTRAHSLLSRHCRVIACEMPGFGQSRENTRTQTVAELATTMATAIGDLGIERFNLLGTSFGARVALWLATQSPERVQALVLESPAAIRPPGVRPPAGTPEQIARQIYAHPERMPPLPPAIPAITAKHNALLARLRGPDRDPALEARMRTLPTPTLVLFGTLDQLMPPELGRHYKELLPSSHLVFVYDAGHAIGSERPEAFAEVTTDFLQRHEAFVISRTETIIHP